LSMEKGTTVQARITMKPHRFKKPSRTIKTLTISIDKW